MNILLCGICGRMGHEVVRLAEGGYRESRVVAGLDMNPMAVPNISIYTSLADVRESVDVIIDFSHHTATEGLLKYAVANSLPAVIATTGHTEEELALIHEAAKHIPLFHSANMSLGVALLVELAKITATTFPDADIEIVETHHNRKLDAPSGTALLLANAIKAVRQKAFFTFGRQGQAKRQPEEIGIHAVRMGNVVGEHEVIVGTDTQTITLKHQAHSRSLFAEGAIAAAEFLVKQPIGLYDMTKMITAD